MKGPNALSDDGFFRSDGRWAPSSRSSRSGPPPPPPPLKNSLSSHRLHDEDLEATNLAPLRTHGCLDPHHLDQHLVLQRPQPIRKDLQVSLQVPEHHAQLLLRPTHRTAPAPPPNKDRCPPGPWLMKSQCNRDSYIVHLNIAL